MELSKKINELQGPIIIFGASGFIGINLFNAISKVRNDVYAITHDSNKAWRLKLNNVNDNQTIHCDITSANSVNKLFEKIIPKTVFNLAAYGAYSKQNNVELIYETNINGTIHILENCKNCAAYIHAGSSSEYGLNANAPKETDTLVPNSHYSVSKISSSYAIEYYARHHNINAVNLRLYSIYGPWEEPDRLIPQLIAEGLKNSFPPLANKNISRDFVYIDDCVLAFIHAALYMNDIVKGKSINVASGKKTTLEELLTISNQVCNISSSPTWGTMPDRQWDVKDWYGYTTTANELIQWGATINLSDGLQKFAMWQKESNYSNLIVPAFNHPILLSKITAIIACYKDGQAIPIMYERLVSMFNQLKIRYEIIFVNDNSPDNTASVLIPICENDENVVAIHHSRNFGSQAAFLSGMEIATGDAVVLMDGDLQDPPEIIPQFYTKWTDGYDVIYGKRVKREMSWIMNVIYKSFYRIFSKLSYINIPQDAGDFSMIDKKVVKELIKLPETEQFLRGLRAWVGFKQIGVDYIRPERMFGVSTNNWHKNFWWARKAIFSFSFAPLEWLTYFGLIVTSLSFFAIIWQIIDRILNPDLPHGITTVIVLILFFGGITILGLSFLGEYISKIFEETKKRPKFIRRSIQKGKKTYNTSEKIEQYIKDNKIVK